MRVVFAGTPQVAVPSLERLAASGHDVAAVLTRPDAPQGRKRVLTPSPVAVAAEALGIPVIRTSAIDAAVIGRLEEIGPEAIPVVAYGVIVPEAALDVPRWGWVNVHFSLLPAWRGAAPVQHAILRGDDITGVTVFRIEKGLDTGPVLATATQAVDPRQTAGELLAGLSLTGADLLIETLDHLAAGDITAVPQQGEVSLAPKISGEQARIDWHDPALAISRLVRATNPEPGAWTELEGRRIKIHRAEVAGVSEVGALSEDAPGPGQVSRIDPTLVGTGSGVLRLKEVQPAGKKSITAEQWGLGARPEGKIFK